MVTTDTRIDTEVVLSVEDLRTHFTTRWGTVKAVDGISFDLRKGETLGIVGESGCGKSVTMLSLMRLIPIPPGQIVSGKIVLDGEDIVPISEQEMASFRATNIPLFIQPPTPSFTRFFSIGAQFKDPINIPHAIPNLSSMARPLGFLRK